MLVRPVMKRLSSLGKPRKKRLALLASLMINNVCIALYMDNLDAR